MRRACLAMSLLLCSVADAAEPPVPAAKAQAPVTQIRPEAMGPPTPVASATAVRSRSLDLRVGDIRKYMTPEEFRALQTGAMDEANTVVVQADAPLLPMKSPLNVQGGILAPFWMLAHPLNAWRLFAPDARVNIKDIPPAENKIPPPEFRWGP